MTDPELARSLLKLMDALEELAIVTEIFAVSGRGLTLGIIGAIAKPTFEASGIGSDHLVFQCNSCSAIAC